MDHKADNSSSCLLSFIVPVYNAEQYVEQCIRSFYDQDIPIEKYEVIVVDDFSSDKSKDVIAGMQKEYSTLHLIAQPENRRQGAARNAGLLRAKGKYVWFVDADDYIKPRVLKDLIKEAEQNNVDILQFNYEHYNDDSIPPFVPYELEVCSGAGFVFDTHERWNKKIGEVWRWIIRKDFLLENGFFFEENVQFEDTDYAIKVLAYAERVKHLDLAPYCYQKVETSVTHSVVTLTHLQYKFLMTIRFAKLITQITNDKRDVRFIPALKEFIHYEAQKTFKAISKFDPSQKMQFGSFVMNTEFYLLKKHLSLYKYWLITRPFFWIHSINLWKLGDSWKYLKNTLKSGCKMRSLANG